MSRQPPSRAGVTKYAGVDLSRPAHELATELGVSRASIRAARRRAGMKPPGGPRATKPGGLSGADLTRPTAELMREYGVTRTAVSWQRRARGIPAPKRAAVAPARPKRVKTPKPAPVAKAPPVAAREPIVAPPAGPADLVALLKDELAVNPSAFSAALVVAARTKRPVDEVRAVAERLMGRAA